MHLLMLRAASQQHVAPDRISFIDTVRCLLSAAPGEALPPLIVNPRRPDRHEPRVVIRLWQATNPPVCHGCNNSKLLPRAVTYCCHRGVTDFSAVDNLIMSSQDYAPKGKERYDGVLSVGRKVNGMAGPWYAHSLAGRPMDQWEPLEEHLRQVAALAREFAGAFGAEQWGELAGLWHDLGKYSAAFQAYLRDQNGIEAEDYH